MRHTGMCRSGGDAIKVLRVLPKYIYFIFVLTLAENHLFV